ncbi:monovalent cation/H(+) antiporter subunit G [Brucella sp. IR073]|uniref:monovalent cation/H(+) antiporter subunit G n=1 Tax=unclassified Brucella TaxID=2632610 RepID=UPI003B9860A6
MGAAVTLIGAIGLLRFRTFYDRIHAPSMGAGFGAGGILLASILFFTVRDGGPVLQPVLIGVFIMITTPVAVMLLTRAALHRHPPKEKLTKTRKRR